jgi:hypothetical protein
MELTYLSTNIGLFFLHVDDEEKPFTTLIAEHAGGHVLRIIRLPVSLKARNDNRKWRQEKKTIDPETKNSPPSGGKLTRNASIPGSRRHHPAAEILVSPLQLNLSQIDLYDNSDINPLTQQSKNETQEQQKNKKVKLLLAFDDIRLKKANTKKSIDNCKKQKNSL